jgi:hypothetical protein
LQLKEKRTKEREQIEQVKRQEEEMLFKDPATVAKQGEEIAMLREMVKKLQVKCS